VEVHRTKGKSASFAAQLNGNEKSSKGTSTLIFLPCGVVFSSSIFLFVFLPIFLSLYWLIPHRARNTWALFASILFYAWGGGQVTLVLLASIAVDYFIAQKLLGTRRVFWLTLGVSLNLGLLVYYKYVGFLVQNTALLFGIENTSLHVWNSVALPIGISFFSFQKISYLVDVYRKSKPPLKSLTDYGLFVLLFPQLIAGPIVRFNDIADQIQERRMHPNDRVLGFLRFVLGLAKKVLIANNLGAIADPLFAQETVTGAAAWTGIVAYTFQIYFDFSGYSDMAIGLGRMMGFRFNENFNFPYLSTSITEFWRRWHISLSTWMRDYLYIPLGGNKRGTVPMLVNLWVVFLLSGLWHGAAWTFVFWGAYHGFWLVVERAQRTLKIPPIPVAMGVPWTFLRVLLGWVLFRAESLPQAWQWFIALGRLDGTFDPQAHVPVTIVLAACASFWAFRPQWQNAETHFWTRTLSSRSMLAYVGLSVLLLYISTARIVSGEYNPFIYFNF
jgi:alginate O-acetyltransferase complex protein AlgI